MEITPTQENYLRSIYLLGNEENQEVRVTDIVAEMELSKSTVAKRLQELTDKGLLHHEKYGPVTLTEQGFKLANNLTYKHRIVEFFLLNILKVSEENLHNEAHLLEHAISDELIIKLAEHLGNPTHCPHGQKIPNFKH